MIIYYYKKKGEKWKLQKKNIYTVVPLFKEEIMYKLTHGGLSLLKEMKNVQSVKDFVVGNPKRQNTFISDEFVDFEKYKDTRIELENPERIIEFEDKGLEIDFYNTK